MKVDVHIIVKPNEPWLGKCLRSLSAEPINLHFVTHTPGSISVPRSEGFKLGDSPYVSFVDPDDEVVPGSFGACMRYLNENPTVSGVYTDEVLMNEFGHYKMYGWSTNEKPFLKESWYRPALMCGIHHLQVIRRSALLPLKTNFLPEPVLMAQLKSQGNLVHLPFVGYKWRLHNGNACRSFTKAHLDQAEEEVRAWRG